MSIETFSLAAAEHGLYLNRWAPLQAKEGELTLQKRKTATWKGVHGCTCSCHKERFLWPCNFFKLLKVWEGLLFQGFYNTDKYYFAKFVSNHLNSDVSSCHLDNCAPFAFLVLCVISGFSIWIKKRKRQMYVSSKFSGDIWWKRKRVLVQAVDLKCLFAFLWQLFITCIPSFWIWIMWGFFLWSWRWSSCFF